MPIPKSILERIETFRPYIRADARGFRRLANYRTRILFFCGKFGLLPNLPV